MELKKAIIRCDAYPWQIGEEVKIYFKDSRYITAKVESDEIDVMPNTENVVNNYKSAITSRCVDELSVTID